MPGAAQVSGAETEQFRSSDSPFRARARNRNRTETDYDYEHEHEKKHQPWAVHALALLALMGICAAVLAPSFGDYFWLGHEEYFPIVRIQKLAALSEGSFLPLHQPWLPDACFGYGWPFFTFYPPLGYWAGAAGVRFGGLSAGAAARLSFYLAYILSALAMYALARLAMGGGARENGAEEEEAHSGAQLRRMQNRDTMRSTKSMEIRWAKSPGGTSENSPPFQRWESSRDHSQVPEGRMNSLTQPMDSVVPPGLLPHREPSPTVETVGYSQLSLRDTAEIHLSCAPHSGGGDFGEGARAAWALAIAAIYALTPYHLVDLYVRSSLAECWAWAALPAAFASLEWSRRRPRAGALALALASAALLLSHTVFAFYGAFLLAGYALATAPNLRWLARAAAAGLLGAAMAAFYWLPAARLLREVRAGDVNLMWGSPEGLWDHALYWIQYVVETPGRSASGFGPNDQLGVNLGYCVLGAALLAAFSMRSRALGEIARRRILFSLGMMAILLFAMTPRMPWDLVPGVFRYVQFPWRFLLFTALLGCLALAGAAPAASRWIHPGAVLFAAALLGIPPVYRAIYRSAPSKMNDAQVKEWYAGMEKRRQFAGCIAREYKPLGAADHFLDPAWTSAHPAPGHRLEILSGDARILKARRAGTAYFYEYAATTETLARAHVFDFPRWELSLDGKPAGTSRAQGPGAGKQGNVGKNDTANGRIASDPEGLVRLRLPAGRHEIILRRAPTPVQRLAAWVSSAGWLLWLVAGAGLAIAAKRGRGIRAN